MLNDINKVPENNEIISEECGSHVNQHVEKPKSYSPYEQPNPHMDMGMGAKPISFIERMFELIFRHGFFKSVGAVLLILGCVMIWQFINAVNYDKIAEKVVQEIVVKQKQDHLSAKEEHAEGSALRIENNPKIINILTRMLYELNADRVSILEMHNGKENPTSLPFIYCDMTYEETKNQVPYIAEEYEQINMSKYSFFTYLMKERVFSGRTDLLWEIDKKFASKIHVNNAKYLAVVTIKNEIEIGFLMVSFLQEPDMDEHQLTIKLTDYAQELGFLLDLTHNHRNCITHNG